MKKVPKRRQERADPEADDERGVQQPDERAARQPCEASRQPVEPVDLHRDDGEGGAEVERDADREVDAAGGDDERHAERHDHQDRRALEHVRQVPRLDEDRVHAGEEDHRRRHDDQEPEPGQDGAHPRRRDPGPPSAPRRSPREPLRDGREGDDGEDQRPLDEPGPEHVHPHRLEADRDRRDEDGAEDRAPECDHAPG